MRILVTAASKHGATAEIAKVIADQLDYAGHDATLVGPDEVKTLAGYDAVVLGSAVYAGRWLDPAKELVDRLSTELAGVEVYLFSSGPIGDPAKPGGVPPDAAAMIEKTAARDHHVFAGRLDRSTLGLAEKVIVSAVGAKEGDFRSWDEVIAWSAEIAGMVGSPRVPVAGA